MKTLDEVIEAQERCATYPNCHFCYLHSGSMCEWIRDALHYLKEYRDAYRNVIASMNHHLRKIHELEQNDPLTWDELKHMEGKPVWVEGQTHKHWCIIKRVFYDDLLGKNFISLMFCNHKGRNDSYQRKESNLGKTWQAYRKERR